uniref:Uncharacterized protein n=1 Tax=Solanum tuberosum TaxID=4113 RepID=M1C8D4_SOLTU
MPVPFSVLRNQNRALKPSEKKTCWSVILIRCIFDFLYDHDSPPKSNPFFLDSPKCQWVCVLQRYCFFRGFETDAATFLESPSKIGLNTNYNLFPKLHPSFTAS